MTSVTNNYATVVVQLARLGDLAQTWPLISRLKESAGSGQTALVVDSRLAPLADLMVGKGNTLPLSLNAGLKEFTTGGLREAWRNAARLKRTLTGGSHGRVVNLNYHPVTAALAEAIPAARHLGARWRDVKAGRPSDNQTRRLFEVNTGLRQGTKHLSDIWAEYADNDTPLECHQPLKLPLDIIETGGGIIRNAGVKSVDAPVAIIIGSGLRCRSLPLDRLINITTALSREAPVILIGSASEARTGEDVVGAVRGDHEPVASLCGQTDDPAVLAGVLGCCGLVVGVDTGPLHMAAMAGTRCLGIYYGSMNFRETGPYGSNHVVITPDDQDYPCHEREMEANPAAYRDSIPSDEIIRTARQMMGADDNHDSGRQVRIFESFTTVEGLAWREIEPRRITAVHVRSHLKYAQT